MSKRFSGKKVRSLRKASKLSQQKLTDKSGVSDRYLRELESGRKNNPSIEVLSNLSDALDCSVDDFLDTVEQPATV